MVWGHCSDIIFTFPTAFVLQNGRPPIWALKLNSSRAHRGKHVSLDIDNTTWCTTQNRKQIVPLDRADKGITFGSWNASKKINYLQMLSCRSLRTLALNWNYCKFNNTGIYHNGLMHVKQKHKLMPRHMKEVGCPALPFRRQCMLFTPKQ